MLNTKNQLPGYPRSGWIVKMKIIKRILLEIISILVSQNLDLAWWTRKKAKYSCLNLAFFKGTNKNLESCLISRIFFQNSWNLLELSKAVLLPSVLPVLQTLTAVRTAVIDSCHRAEQDLLEILDLELLILVSFLLDAFFYFCFLLEFQDRFFNQSCLVLILIIRTSK